MAPRPKAANNRRDRYLELVKELPLRPIRSEAELDRAITMIDSLSDRAELGPDEQDYMIVLSDLIEKYEDEHHPMPSVTGAEMLQHLIEAKGVTQAEVAAETGLAESTLSEILRGKRGLSAKYMPALARYFHVSPAVFISD